MIESRLGPYEITAKLGEGGMGEVYRARDTRLERDVAIKVLPAAFVEDDERLARFEREAKLLAQLNHPNIAHIYGLEASGDAHALVMELVEGPTLAERLEQGHLPLEESLSLARQIAEALEEAHEKGIIHRDLKPQNIKASVEGKVKVLDFGLAKAMDPATSVPGSGAGSHLAKSPTLTMGATVHGMILGTAAYMAPEQAKGFAVDKRADIWAFGVVLYEMLTGQRLFAGDSVPDTLAGVLKTEIDLSKLPAETPAAIRRLLRRCLERNPKSRLHDIADARIVIDEVVAGRIEEAPASPTPAAVRHRWWSALPWILAVGLASVLMLRLGRAPAASSAPGERALEFSVPLGNLLADDAELAFSPDGSSIVFTALDPALGPQLWLRRLDSFDVQLLHGTAGATFPFWSPDGKSIAFFRDADATLCRYELATATVQVITKVQSGGRSGTWGADGTILFTPSSNSPIQRVAASGGKVEDVTALDPKVLDGSHRYPIFLPDGHHFLFTFWSNQLEAASRVGGIYLASLEKGIERRLTPDLSQAVLVGRDRILVRRAGALVALPFDPKTFDIASAGERITDQPRFSSSSGALAATGTAAGDLAYAPGSGETGGELVWLDRQGQKVGTFGSERLRAQLLVLSPDDRNFAAQAVSSSGMNIWVGDARRQVISRLSADAVDAYFPVWSPDGRRIAFESEPEGSESIYVQEADGSRPAELLLSEPDRNFNATGWSADGRLLFLQSSAKRAARTDLWVYDFTGRAARALLTDTSASLGEATPSADGKWLAYVSDESGNPEVFVRPFPALDRKWKISQGGALHPHWRRDGRELVFVGLADRAVMAVDVTPGPDGLDVGIPHRLFDPRTQLLGLAPSADHTRFLAGIIPGDVRTEPIRVLLGWRGASGGESKR
ncbi:MAG: protein kinase domain-containing protein [Acidobacteriota bacterium]